MHVPTKAVIAADKLTRYLLAPRPVDDKSRFLARAGFVASEPHRLEAAVRRLAAENPASEDTKNVYGTFWRVEGLLAGPRADLPVVAIWLERAIDGAFHFVTLKPLKATQP